MKQEIKDLTEKADKFLLTAQRALSSGDYDSCVSRCYYAMFFMAEAALLTKNITSSSHKGVISLFGEHFIKTNIFARSMGAALNDAYDKRLVGDYGIGVEITEEQGNILLETARDFVTQVKDYLQEQK